VKPWSKNRTRVALALIATGGVLLGTAPDAEADPGLNQVIEDEVAAGFFSTDPDGIAHDAQVVCAAVPKYPLSAIAASLAAATSVTLAGAMEFITIAITDLCPQEASATQPATPPEKMHPLTPNPPLQWPADPPQSAPAPPPRGSDL
jgi:hypothetical protein